MPTPYDAVLLIAFGGPTQMSDVRPFLDIVLQGRPIPPDRLELVVHHYERIGGRSPMTELTQRQAAALAPALQAAGVPLPVYIGMRNWHPFLRDTLADMWRKGVRHALGFIMTAQQSEPGWQRYQQDVASARAALGDRAPAVDYVAPWYDHPRFIETVSNRLITALETLSPSERASAEIVFTAHSIPVALAARDPYVAQLETGMRLIAQRAALSCYRLAYQSRSGNPREPWLEPDILVVLKDLAKQGTRTVVVVPFGFVCDHVEVLYDLDIEARALAESLGMRFVRALAPNDHPTFIQLMTEVIAHHVAAK